MTDSRIGTVAAALLRLAIYAVLALGISLLGRSLYLAQSNTLANNGRWVSSKMDLSIGTVGAFAYYETRAALHRDRLNLGAWHGYQELLYGEPITLETLSLRFRLDDGSALAVMVQQNAEGSAGVVLSRAPPYATGCFTTDPEGRFRSREPLEAALPEADGEWHRLSVRVEGDRFRLELDGLPGGTCSGLTELPGNVGFREIGSSGTRIDDVEIRSRAPRLVFVEDFDNTDLENRAGGGRLTVVVALLIVGALGGALYLGVRRLTGSSRRAEFALITGAVVALLTVGLFWVADHYYLSGLHRARPDLGAHKTRIETAAEVRARLRDTLPTDTRPGTRRILLLGSSQTWGAGAARSADVFGHRLERRLNEGGGSPVELITAAISGVTSAELFQYYMSEWLRLAPDVVVLNLGNNDGDLKRFSSFLSRFAQVNEARGIRTVFITEPNAPDQASKIGERHEILREVARRHGVPVIELHAWLLERGDTGFLWWDSVHLSSYGHALVAEHLYEQRAILLGN